MRGEAVEQHISMDGPQRMGPGFRRDDTSYTRFIDTVTFGPFLMV
jgi:hypothetical protein